MKKWIISTVFACLAIATVAFSEFFPDIIVTSPNGVWTDVRAYTSINAAVTAIGANERDLYIVRQETTTALTIPANITLHFLGSGSIANSGQLTINTRNIYAGNRQIFTGSGDIDFANGSTVRSAWFANLATAITRTNDDTLTLIISEQDTIAADVAIGNNVNLKWEAPYNIITVSNGFTLSNVKMIEAGDYILFGGAGDIDFLDGTKLNLAWFDNLRDALAWIESELVTITVSEPTVVDSDETVPANVALNMVGVGSFSVTITKTLTINGGFNAGMTQVFAGAGTVDIGRIKTVYPEWWGAVGDGITDDTAAINSAVANYRTIVFTNTYLVTTLSFTGLVNTTFTSPGFATISSTTAGDTFTFTNCKVSISNLYINGAGKASGSGLYFHATSSSQGVCDIINCWIQENPESGIKFVGDASHHHSGARIIGNKLLSNLGDQLYCEYFDDFFIEDNQFGAFGSPYPTHGCYLENSGAGTYTKNYHWNNLVGLETELSHYNKFIANRVEMSQHENAIFADSVENIITNNIFHTASMAGTGTYANVKLENMDLFNFSNNIMFTWDAGIKPTYNLVVDSASNESVLLGNISRQSTLGDYNIKAGYDDSWLYMDDSNWPSLETVTTSKQLQSWGISYLDSSGGALACTLLRGYYPGQLKTIFMTDATNPSTVTISAHEAASPNILTFNAVGDRIVLVWEGWFWATVTSGGLP